MIFVEFYTEQVKFYRFLHPNGNPQRNFDHELYAQGLTNHFVVVVFVNISLVYWNFRLWSLRSTSRILFSLFLLVSFFTLVKWEGEGRECKYWKFGVKSFLDGPKKCNWPKISRDSVWKNQLWLFQEHFHYCVCCAWDKQTFHDILLIMPSRPNAKYRDGETGSTGSVIASHMTIRIPNTYGKKHSRRKIYILL